MAAKAKAKSKFKAQAKSQPKAKVKSSKAKAKAKAKVKVKPITAVSVTKPHAVSTADESAQKPANISIETASVEDLERALAKARAQSANVAAPGGPTPNIDPNSDGSSVSGVLKVGRKARLKGLQGAPELNGCIGNIVAYDSDRERWHFVLDKVGTVKYVKGINLEPISKTGKGKSETKIGKITTKTKNAAAGNEDKIRNNTEAQTIADATPTAGRKKWANLLEPKKVSKVVGSKAAKNGKEEHGDNSATQRVRRSNAGAKISKDDFPGSSDDVRDARDDDYDPEEKTSQKSQRKSGLDKGKTNSMKKSSKTTSPQKNVASKAKSTPRKVSSRATNGLKRAAADADIDLEAVDEEPYIIPEEDKKHNVAFLLRKLASAEGDEDVPDIFPSSSPKGRLSMKGKADTAAIAAEIEAAEAHDGDDGLDGEAKGQRAVRPAKRRKEEDEDVLFDAGEDLSDEEVISNDSDAEDGDDDEDFADLDWKTIGALEVPDVWSGSQTKPGEPNFNEFAAGCISRAKLGSSESPFADLGMRLHQESAAFLLHPQNPISRLLVDHATGTGKTLIMLRTLDNYFDDPRPKVAIFPKERVCDNFYKELLKWPTRWRQYFSHLRPLEAGLASCAKNWRRKQNEIWDLQNERIRFEAKRRNVRIEKVVKELVAAIRETLEMKKSIHRGRIKPKYVAKLIMQYPDVPIPRAPLRALRYTTAGGGACELGRDGWPQSPLLKVGFDPKELNPYSRKIVIMDECHNLSRPSQVYEEQLGRLRTYLSTAQEIILAGFSGTPVGNEALEGRVLLDVIKGEAAKHLSDEGFVSSFHARRNDDFPREEPVRGIPDGVIHEGMIDDLIKRHSLHGEALKRYILKEVDFQITPRLLRLPPEKRVARLANYCNMQVHYGSFHGQNRAALLRDPKGHAPKMHSIAKMISKSKEKCVVMMSREMGFRPLLEILRRTGKQAGFKVATLEEIADFNDARRNLRGERFRVLAAESGQAGEGIQFRHVRRIYLVDVPLRHSDLVQRCSRCVRLGGHAELPPEERTLAIELHVAQLPKFLRQGPASLIYRELLNAKEVNMTSGAALEAATEECLKELRRREIKTLPELQVELQKPDGEQFIELLTETALEQLGDTSNAPARPLAMALWRLRKGGDDIQHLENALLKQGQRTADEQLVDALIDKSAELLPPLETMRLGAVDRALLAPLGDPPKAPPPRSVAAAQRLEKSRAQLKHKSKKVKQSSDDKHQNDQHSCDPSLALESGFAKDNGEVEGAKTKMNVTPDGASVHASVHAESTIDADANGEQDAGGDDAVDDIEEDDSLDAVFGGLDSDMAEAIEEAAEEEAPVIDEEVDPGLDEGSAEECD